ncbi:hypothetical protein F7734_35015 [Scytonema sp. UIC 10036]|uniref:hypothetical protein n=1 Tax=Scytonema sp. UIC 10036 TaxID=2304196 RepID=UPI0012DAB61B|nr:hypothetical protein [Scytonema sp. UIC 10036]MUG97265.1 hypothetical protein [Scytonema sp. UIC 10036]
MQKVLGLRKEDVEPIEERILGNTSETEASDRLSPIEQTLKSQSQTVVPELNASIDISARPPGAQRGTQANDLRSASTLRKLLPLAIGVGITTTMAIATFISRTPRPTPPESESSSSSIQIPLANPLTKEKCQRYKDLYPTNSKEIKDRVLKIIGQRNGPIRKECEEKWKVEISNG